MIGLAAQAPSRPRDQLKIGLVNNMPDAALAATERQFRELLAEAGCGADIQLRLYALAGVKRGERANAFMEGRYAPAEACADDELDGLIVTGAEPKEADLRDEPYWPAFARLVDWADDAGVPSVWSCLAAHAAVLQLDGVRRRVLPRKLSGVFVSEPARADPLLAGAPAQITPHSRLNEVAEDDLVRRGYRILTRSREAGVDAFVRRDRSPQLFLQGHPEYDADSLAREYARDVSRYLAGERTTFPQTPHGYLDQRTEEALAQLARRALRRPTPDLNALVQVALSMAAPRRSWRASGLCLFNNWLSEAAGRPLSEPASWTAAQSA